MTIESVMRKCSDVELEQFLKEVLERKSDTLAEGSISEEGFLALFQSYEISQHLIKLAFEQKISFKQACELIYECNLLCTKLEDPDLELAIREYKQHLIKIISERQHLNPVF